MNMEIIIVNFKYPHEYFQSYYLYKIGILYGRKCHVYLCAWYIKATVAIMSLSLSLPVLYHHLSFVFTTIASLSIAVS